MRSNIISFVGKVNVGKTSLAYNFGRYLSKNHKVLMIDLGTDFPGNLTNLMNMSNKKKNNADIYTFFKNYSNNNLIKETGISPQLINTSDGEELYALTNTYGLDQNNINKLRFLNENINSIVLKKYLLANNYTNEFDYIIIDTSASLYQMTTKMAIVASDTIFCPLLPNNYCESIVKNMPTNYQKIKNSVTDFYGNTLVKAKMYWIINEASKSTSTSKYFIDFMKNKNNFICTFYLNKWLSEFKKHKIYVIDYINLQSPKLPRLKYPRNKMLNNFSKMKEVII